MTTFTCVIDFNKRAHYPRSRVPLVKESTCQKIDRSACAFAQARRIEAYLPTLEERERHLQGELEELRALVADERAALKDLLRETHQELRKGPQPTSLR